MRFPSDNELLSFAAKVLERSGGAVQWEGPGFFALLPAPVSRALSLGEEVSFGPQGIGLTYGHPVLERLVALATSNVPVVYCTVEIPYLKRGGFENILARDISFWRMGSKLWDHAESKLTYLDLVCRYVALSDERKEGLLRITVQEKTGAVVPDFEKALARFRLTFHRPEHLPSEFPTEIEGALKAALSSMKELVKRELESFLQNAARRLERDIRNTREYYQALEQEMGAQAQRTGLSRETRTLRLEKIKTLPAEMERKIEDLRRAYRTEVRLHPCGATRILMRTVRLTLELRYRKLKKKATLTYNPLTQALDPWVCECCGVSTRNVYPKDDGPGFLLCCAKCSETK